jgi:hypothetical protein
MTDATEQAPRHGQNRPLRRWRHPGTKEYYQQLADGTVEVTRDDGRSGIFHVDGRYISGDLTQVSKHMLVWTGQPELPDAFNYRWTMVPVDIERPSGWPEEQDAIWKQLGEAKRRG